MPIVVGLAHPPLRFETINPIGNSVCILVFAVEVAHTMNRQLIYRPISGSLAGTAASVQDTFPF
jgi:hypothetical protein